MADSGGDWLGFLGLLGAATIASAGAYYNNKKQMELQKQTNDTAIDLANTAHQREVADLKAAGLNPILSATGSGAATPSLGTAHLDNVLDSFGSNARGISDVMSKRRSLENQSVVSQIRKTNADTDASIATAKNLEVQNRNLQAQTDNIRADTELKRKEMTSRSSVGRIYEDVKSITSDVPKQMEKHGVELNRAGFLVPVNSARGFSHPAPSTPGYRMPQRSRPRSGNRWRFRKPDNLGN